MGVTAIFALAAGLVSGVAGLLRPGARARRLARRALRSVEKERVALDTTVESARGRLRGLGHTYAEHAAEARLAGLPVAELRNFGADKVRWNALQEGGFETVADLRGVTKRQLLDLDGIGRKSAPRILKARNQMLTALAKEPVALPAVGADEPQSVALLGGAHEVLRRRDRVRGVDRELAGLAGELGEQVAEVERGASLWRRLTRRSTWEERERALELAGEIGHSMKRGRGDELLRRSREERAALAAEAVETPTPKELAAEHAARFADYSALLEEALGRTEAGGVPSDSTRGGLPREIAERVEAFELRTDGLRVTLRGYQAFGAKYALVQERVLVGDEMGLGKTVEALAVFAHLRAAEDARHFLAVVPASVLHNWVREVGAHCDLPVHLFHGAERAEVLARWRAEGGVGVTSFSTLKRLTATNLDELRADALVVDEAHYAKNPEAERTRAVHVLAARCRWVVFLTGTPIENRLEDFQSLVQPLQPDVARRLARDSVAAEVRVGRRAFLEAVSPVYLRRNQVDVLTEIPPRVDKEEWVELRDTDVDAYRAAVAERDAMAMRVAATLGDARAESGKLERLVELLAEYRAEGAKVIVFSYFLDVLSALRKRFAESGPVHGPIQGSVPPDERMAICDAFQGTDGHALLLAQIQAGGVGLNLQAASVVVLMEPQWKPSTEEQAIARAHRMGQSRIVMVHRLLARHTIDERMVEALAEKRELFDDFARRSLVGEASGQATESELVRQIVDAEVERWASAPPHERADAEGPPDTEAPDTEAPDTEAPDTEVTARG